MLEELLEVAGQLGISTRLVRQEESGDIGSAVILQHERRAVVAFDQGTYVLLTHVIEIPPRIAEVASRRPNGAVSLVEYVTHGVGPSRCTLVADIDVQDGKPIARRLVVEQRVVLEAGRPETGQRLADGLVEILNVAILSASLLSQTAEREGRPPSRSGPDEPSEGMFR